MSIWIKLVIELLMAFIGTAAICAEDSFIKLVCWILVIAGCVFIFL